MSDRNELFRRFLREDWLLLLGLGTVVLLTILVYPIIPDEIPIHWNWRGEPDRWASKAYGAWILPAVALASYLFTTWLLTLDPRRENFEKFPGTLRIFRLSGPLLLLGLQAAQVAIWLDLGLEIDAVVYAGIGLLYAVLGNYMGRIRPNFFVGIRVPWTLDSDRVWRKTHRFAGPLWFLGGIALLYTPFLPAELRFLFFGIVTFTLVFFPIVYSYYTYEEEKD